MRRIGLIVVAVLLGVSARVEAQWGFGWGIFGYQPSPSTTFLNDRALVGAAAAYNNRPQSLRQAMPMYGGRDPAFFQRYDLETRRALEDQVRRPRTTGERIAVASPRTPAAAPTTSALASIPVVALASFFNKNDVLVWPSEAPVSGDLGTKRTTADAASLDALQEQRERGAASMATTMDARNKLLDYGRPALAVVRSSATPAVADSFHRFLLSLYDALGNAIKPARNP